ncbi:kinase-like domain-containing protein [Sparassis latifolia]
MIISMPLGGGWITYLDLNAHLWGASQQLFEAVGFMHDHGVAHMDLKPGNIVIPPIYGRLSIIDFSIAERVRGPGYKLKGYAGTRGYTAPEVGRVAYCPIRADLWSCGKVIEELCEGVKLSFARTWLRQVSTRLMDNDPDKRPMMTEILQAMSKVGSNSEH